MKQISISFAHIQSIFSRLPTPSRMWIAYSGGVDSSVLLHLLSQNRSKPDYCSITAVYVNHQLSPKADEWAEHCKAVCDQLKTEFTTVKINAEKLPGHSLEARARELRYEALENMMSNGDVLLTGHNKNDQAETLVLRIMRGSGVDGLAGMQHIRKAGPGWLVRPLLDFSREQIMEYAKNHALKWIEDESNRDTGIERNFVRHTVIPCLEQRWPSSVDVLSRAADHQAEAGRLLGEIAGQDFDICCKGKPGILDIKQLEKLSTERIKNLLRFWLKKNSHPSANSAVLDKIIKELIHARNDSTPMVKWRDTEIRRYRDNIHVMKPLTVVPADTDYQWNLEYPLATVTGSLVARRVIGEGIKTESVGDTRLNVRYRRGGETIRPAGRKETHKLKKLFQDAGVPPWQRDRVPLLFINNQLAMVVGFWTDEKFMAGQSESGWEISLTNI